MWEDYYIFAESNNYSGFLARTGLIVGALGTTLSLFPFLIFRVVSYILGIVGVIVGVLAIRRKDDRTKATVSLLLGVLVIVLTFTFQRMETIDNLKKFNQERQLKKQLEIDVGSLNMRNFSSADKYMVPVKVTNNGDNAGRFSIVIEAIDTSGKTICKDVVLTDKINTGETEEYTAFTVINEKTAQKLKSAEFKVSKIRFAENR